MNFNLVLDRKNALDISGVRSRVRGLTRGVQRERKKKRGGE
jgi:hypothetical protein